MHNLHVTNLLQWDVLYDSYLISGVRASGIGPRLGRNVSEGFIVPGWRIMFFVYFFVGRK